MRQDRTLPHNLEAERSLVGAWFLLSDDPAEIRRTRIDPGLFLDPKLQVVAAALLSCLDDGIPIDPATVTHRIARTARDEGHARDLAATLAECASETGGPHRADQYAHLVENAAALRAIVYAAERAHAAALGAGAEAGEIRANLEAEVAQASLTASRPIEGKAATYIPEAMLQAMTRRDEAGRDGRLSWGIRELDRAGVFVRPGSFPVVAARPGCGKTTFLRRWAFRTAHATQRKVIYLTLEQDPVELVYDELMAEAGVKDPCGAGISSGEDADRLVSASAFLESVPLYAPTTFPHKLGSLVTWLHQTIAKEKPVAVVLDYLTLVQANGANVNERASLISSRLRSVAKQTGCPIVCAAQLNRASAGDRREPELHDLRDSGQIEQDATSVMMLHYPYAQATREDRMRGAVDPSNLTLMVKKNRHGASFVRVEMRFDGAYKRMLAKESTHV